MKQLIKFDKKFTQIDGKKFDVKSIKIKSYGQVSSSKIESEESPHSNKIEQIYQTQYLKPLVEGNFYKKKFFTNLSFLKITEPTILSTYLKNSRNEK